ncbi:MULTISPECIES: response regulator transcription factor [Paraburkholderia]|uniref:response regulator transcription factor n=1 Tax=Paraburkholderia TaxID=1822464 RepID=UPI001980D175|nr:MULTISPECIES: response regulator transcription factor [Paraburkholderia]MBN3811625.1 response regulator transcription factor [Paraburkholderia sp. Ac-20347]
MKIAVLDKDQHHAAFVHGVLAAGGFDCKIFIDSRVFLREAERDEYRMLILDWDAGQYGGEAVLGWAKKNFGAHFPVMFVTSRQAEGDMVKALCAGADDYLIRPVDASLLLASVRKLLRWPYGRANTHSVDVFGAIEFHSENIVLVEGIPVVLAPKEYALAHILFTNINRRISRKLMARKIWSHKGDKVSRTIDTHIHNLRVKLGLYKDRGYTLRAIHGFGYELREDHESLLLPVKKE